MLSAVLTPAWLHPQPCPGSQTCPAASAAPPQGFAVGKGRAQHGDLAGSPGDRRVCWAAEATPSYTRLEKQPENQSQAKG